MKQKFRLGIDLATRHIGICMLDESNTIKFKCTLELQPFTYEYEKMFKNIVLLTSFISILSYSFIPKELENTINTNDLEEPHKTFENYIQNENNFKDIEIDIGIEVSNYGNPNLANKFNFYAGVLYMELISAKVPWKINNIKIINANQWEFKCGSRPKDERDRRKKNTRNFIMNHCDRYSESWTEDECDAYCIAYWLDELKNTDELHEEVKKTKRDKNKKNWILYTLERKLNSRLAELASLDKVRNSKRIETVKANINQIKEEIENVKKKTNNSNS